MIIIFKHLLSSVLYFTYCIFLFLWVVTIFLRLPTHLPIYPSPKLIENSRYASEAGTFLHWHIPNARFHILNEFTLSQVVWDSDTTENSMYHRGRGLKQNILNNKNYVFNVVSNNSLWFLQKSFESYLYFVYLPFVIFMGLISHSLALNFTQLLLISRCQKYFTDFGVFNGLKNLNE